MTTEAQNAGLLAHLQTGATTVCRCWSVERADGTVLAFTDHDRPLAFGGLSFRPDTGLEAAALVQTTGLSVDNSEGMGALSDSAISEADILAGRYDNAKVLSWLVNWSDPEMRSLVFRGTIGEVRWSNGAFRAELRGQSESLNQPQGLVYQAPCSAILGDARCGVDLTAPGMQTEALIEEIQGGRVFRFTGLGGFEDGWFTRGRLRVLDGLGDGLIGLIKSDRTEDGERAIELWEALRVDVALGDIVRLEAGCDRRVETCKSKFNNFVNFRGFPHIPGEDWLTSYPRSGGQEKSGRSLFDQPIENSPFVEGGL